MRSKTIEPVRGMGVALGILLLAAACAGTPSGNPPAGPTNDKPRQPHDFSQTPPEEVVAYLIELPHGLSDIEPNVSSALTRLRAEPAAAVRAVRTQASPEQALADPQGPALERLEFAIVLLGQLRAPEADAVLGEWYAALGAGRRATADGLDPAQRMQYLILDTAHGRYLAPIAEDLVDRWPAMEETERAISANYLAASARGRSNVAARLRALLGSGADDALIQRVLEKIAP